MKTGQNDIANSLYKYQIRGVYLSVWSTDDYRMHYPTGNGKLSKTPFSINFLKPFKGYVLMSNIEKPCYYTSKAVMG